MDASWPLIISSMYLTLLALTRMFTIVYRDLRQLRRPRKTPKHQPENWSLSHLFAQYQPTPLKNQESPIWWQHIQDVVNFIEPLAVVYFLVVAIFSGEPTPLIISLSIFVAEHLNNIWQSSDFSVLKKLRLTLLLPSQLVPYYALRLTRTLKYLYAFIAKASHKFASHEISFPLRLGPTEKRQ